LPVPSTVFTKNGFDNGIKPGQPTHRLLAGFNRHLRGALRRLLKVRTFTNSGSLSPLQYGYSPHHRLGLYKINL